MLSDRSTRRARRPWTAAAAAILFAALHFSGAAHAGPDLGDFQIPAERVPDWYPPPEIPDTTGWAVLDATDPVAMEAAYCDPADPAPDTFMDTMNIQCAIEAVDTPGVVYLPPGIYDMFSGQGIVLGRSDVVLRGAGPDKTRIRIDKDFSTGLKIKQCGMIGMAHIEVCQDVNLPDPAVLRKGGPPWVAGASVLHVEDTSVLLAGDWIIVTQDNDPKKINRPQHGVMAAAHFYVTKIATVDGPHQITLDRPLRDDFDYENQRVARFEARERIGIEDLELYWENTDYPPSNNIAGVRYIRVVESWIKNVVFNRQNHISVQYQISARNLLRDSLFKDSAWRNAGNRLVVYQQGASDNVAENNVFDDADPLMYQVGATGNVAAYNYFIGGEYRQIFFHGGYVTETLVEGNHVEPRMTGVRWGGITLDNRWGMQGPRNTLFRNRTVVSRSCYQHDPKDRKHASTCVEDADCRQFGPRYTCEEHQFHIRTHADKGVARFPISVELNVLANSTGQMSSRCGPDAAPPARYCSSFDMAASFPGGAHLERNLVRGGLKLGGAIDATASVSNALGANRAPASWKKFRGPASLYRSSAPSWWCREACPFSLQGGIGAFGDDMTPRRPTGKGAYCKLPAQIRHEGGVCTSL